MIKIFIFLFFLLFTSSSFADENNKVSIIETTDQIICELKFDKGQYIAPCSFIIAKARYEIKRCYDCFVYEKKL